jgi:Protein of unknown function (DUF2637)
MNPAVRVQRRLAQMAGVELGWRLQAGELLAWAVTALALVMSYHAEQDLGQSLKAFRGWPALLWPLSVDIADVGLMVLYLEYKRLRLSTWKVGLGMVAATAVMIAANVRSAWGDPTAVAMQAWVPAIALWLWHTLAAGRKPRGAPVDLATVWARMTGGELPPGKQPQELPADGLDDAESHGDQQPSPAPGAVVDQPVHADDDTEDVRNPQPRQPARVEVRRLLSRHRGALTHGELHRLAVRVHERTGVSIPHARRLLRDEHHPRLVTEAPQGSRTSAEVER